MNEVRPSTFLSKKISLLNLFFLSIFPSSSPVLPTWLPGVGVASNITTRTGTGNKVKHRHTPHKHTHTHTLHVEYAHIQTTARTDNHTHKHMHKHTHAGLQGQGHTSCDLGLWCSRKAEVWWREKEEMRREEEDRERVDDGQKMISRYNDPLHWYLPHSRAICSCWEGGWKGNEQQ